MAIGSDDRPWFVRQADEKKLDPDGSQGRCNMNTLTSWIFLHAYLPPFPSLPTHHALLKLRSRTYISLVLSVVPSAAFFAASARLV